MSKNQDLKKLVVDEIAQKLKNCQSMVMVRYSGLTVEQATALRVQCRAAQVDYCVMKNTLVKRALEACGITGLDDLLAGPNAFAFCGDPVSAAKVICEFISKDKQGALELRGGLLDGKAVNVQTIQSLATLPSREVLLSRLLGSMTATISSFVRVLEAIRKQKAGEE
jgi:large subunit ribosomal protein L10